MPKNSKLYEDDKVIIYAKGQLEVGKEPEVADILLTEAMVGYKTFASHLKEPNEFLDEVYLKIDMLFEELRNQFKQ